MYESFGPLNREVLRVCTDWQVRPGGAPNDHVDAAYDWSVIDRLTAVDERAGPLLRRLGGSVPHSRRTGNDSRGAEARRRRRARLVHITTCRLVPHGVDGAP